MFAGAGVKKGAVMGSTDEAGAKVAELRRLSASSDRRDDPLEISLQWPDELTREQCEKLGDIGVDRVVVRPWTRGRDAIAAITAFAERMGLAEIAVS